jgi:hypothetical protein
VILCIVLLLLLVSLGVAVVVLLSFHKQFCLFVEAGLELVAARSLA